MPPFNVNGTSLGSLHNNNNKAMNGHVDDDDDDGSIGSNTFREIRRKAYEKEGETDEQLFNQHNTIQSLFDNRHHDVNFDDDLNSAGSSLGGYSDLGPGGGDNASKIGGETREDMRMSLIARRRRLAQMENAMAEEGSVDFSLRLNKKKKGAGGLDASSLVSSLRDSIISLGDSAQFSSRKSSKKKKKGKDKKKKPKKSKSSSKDKERERRKEKERKERERKKRKQKEKEKEKKKKSKRRDYSSDETSSESESSRSSSSSERYNKRRSEKNGSSSRDKGGRAVVKTKVDKDTGKCAYHSDVRLKRKSRDGRWKVVLKQCPKCVKEADRKSRKEGKGESSSSRRRRKGSDDDDSDSSSEESAPKKKVSSGDRRGGKDGVPQKSSSRRPGESSRGASSQAPSRTSGRSGAPSSSSRQRSSKPSSSSRSRPHDHGSREFAESQATKKTLETHGTMRTFETGATRSTLKTGHLSNPPSKSSSSRHHNSRDLKRANSREIAAVDFDPPSKYNGGSKPRTSHFNESYQERAQDEVVIRDTVPKQDSSTYNIGDEGKKRDMIKDDDKAVAIKRISRLRSGDAAFIRRTTGNWTFAKVKSVSPDSILFIVDEKGATKDYKKKYWGSHVRAAERGIKASGDGGRFSLDNLP